MGYFWFGRTRKQTRKKGYWLRGWLEDGRRGRVPAARCSGKNKREIVKGSLGKSCCGCRERATRVERGLLLVWALVYKAEERDESP